MGYALLTVHTSTLVNNQFHKLAIACPLHFCMPFSAEYNWTRYFLTSVQLISGSIYNQNWILFSFSNLFIATSVQLISGSIYNQNWILFSFSNYPICLLIINLLLTRNTSRHMAAAAAHHPLPRVRLRRFTQYYTAAGYSNSLL